MPNLGFGELVLILMLALLVFGWKRLPELGDGMGKAIKNFKRGLNSNDDIDVSPSQPRQIDERSSAQRVEDADVVDRKRS